MQVALGYHYLRPFIFIIQRHDTLLQRLLHILTFCTRFACNLRHNGIHLQSTHHLNCVGQMRDEFNSECDQSVEYEDQFCIKSFLIVTYRLPLVENTFQFMTIDNSNEI